MQRRAEGKQAGEKHDEVPSALAGRFDEFVRHLTQ